MPVSDTTNNIIEEIFTLDFVWKTFDPFLFCVHHYDEYPPGDGQLGVTVDKLKGRHIGNDFQTKDGFRMYHGDRVPGFPAHPHRGFETVTYVRQGLIDHADSWGQAGRYGQGDVQWMTAGSGLQHSEMFPLLDEKNSNVAELFQLWLNLPAKKKMATPHFKMLWAADMPRFTLKDSQGRNADFELAYGKFLGLQSQAAAPDSWAFDEANQVVICQITLEANAQIEIPAADESGGLINRALYVFDGDHAVIGGEVISRNYGVRVKAGQPLKLRAADPAQDQGQNQKSKILLLQGRAIGEPVAQYGPFVMNTRHEIQQAFDDYQRDQFGGWPWKSSAVTHEHRGRFARYRDGREELPH